MDTAAEKTERKTAPAAAFLLAGVGTAVIAAYALQHGNVGLPSFVAGQTVPMGLNVMRKQAGRLWPQMTRRLKIFKNI